MSSSQPCKSSIQVFQWVHQGSIFFLKKKKSESTVIFDQILEYLPNDKFQKS
jgi:hypothetical protein